MLCVNLWDIFLAVEKLLVFVFEIRSKDTFSDVFLDFLLTPESATSQFFLARLHLTVVYAAVNVYQFLFPLTFKDIMSQRLRFEIGDTQLFPYFTMKRLIHTLA